MKALSFFTMFFMILNYSLFSQEETQVLTSEQVSKMIEALEETKDEDASEEEKRVKRKFVTWLGQTSKKGAIALGRGASFVSTETIRPFVKASSFLRGAFTKNDSVNDRVRTLAFNFFLDNEKELKEIYQKPEIYSHFLSQSGTTGSIYTDYTKMIQGLIKYRVLQTTQSLLRIVKFDPLVSYELYGESKQAKISQATTLEELKVMLSSVDPLVNVDSYIALADNIDCLNEANLVNQMNQNGLSSLTSYIDFKRVQEQFGILLSGNDEVTTADLMDLLSENFVNDLRLFLDDFVNFEKGLFKNTTLITEASEMIGTIVARFTIPGAVLSGISKTLAKSFIGVTLAADLTSAVSLFVCSRGKSMKHIKGDKDFRSFCSYVIFRNSQKIFKSKAKGYLAGQKFRENIVGHIAAYKERRNQIKQCMVSQGKSRKECRDQFVKTKKNYIQNCQENLGLSKRACRKKRREEFRALRKMN